MILAALALLIVLYEVNAWLWTKRLTLLGVWLFGLSLVALCRIHAGYEQRRRRRL